MNESLLHVSSSWPEVVRWRQLSVNWRAISITRFTDGRRVKSASELLDSSRRSIWQSACTSGPTSDA